MIPSIIKKTISLAISLLVVVISLTGVALGATAPTVNTALTTPRYTPGFAGTPGKMARDAAGNFYVTDFWGKGIVKLDRQGGKIGFIPTLGRPTAVAVLADNRLAVAMSAPQAYVAFYRQLGTAPNVSGEEQPAGQFTVGTGVPLYRPVAITVDTAGYIYVLDSGDVSGDMNYLDQIVVPGSIYVPNVKVYTSAGVWHHEFGHRTYPYHIPVAGENDYFKQPQGLAYEKTANQIVVVDTENYRLQYFTAGTVSTFVKSIGASANTSPPSITTMASFYNPVALAFEYNDSAVLQRAYVVEKARNEISVFDPATTFWLSSINDTTPGGTAMKLPSSILFERTGTGVSTAGVVYTANAATSTPANIRVLGVDTGTVPVPVVAMTMAAVAPTTAGVSLPVSGTTSPATAVSCSVNGGTGTVATGTSTWSATLTLQANSLNYIVCQSTSGGVTTYKEASTYSGTDSTVVTVTITSPPTTGLYTNSTSVTVTGLTTPGNASVQLVNSLGGTTNLQSDASGAWSTVVTLAEGSNQLTATAWKPGTAISAPDIHTVVADFTPPNMTNTISFLAAGATTTKALQNLDGIVLDANLQSITVNGVTVPAAAKVAMAGNNTYFSIPVTLVRGLNTVSVTATDLAGNSTTLSRAVTLAPELPGFTVATPVDNKWKTTVGTEAANGAYDTTFTSVVACGTAATLNAGNWTATTPSIGTGFVSCQFTASGGGNTTVNEKRTFNTNGTYGLVAITTPATDLVTSSASIGIAGSVTPGTLNTDVKISVNGGAATNVTGYTQGTGLFTANTVTLSPGLNSVKIISNATTAIRNIIYDATTPDLTIMADSKTTPTKITGSIDPNATFTLVAKNGAAVVPIPASKITFDPYDGSGSVVWHVDLNGYVYTTIKFTATAPSALFSSLDFINGIPTGDIDGDGTVRLADALAALRHVANTELITDPTKFFNGDVGALVQGKAARDGIIDISDAVLILRKAYGLMDF